MFELSLLQSVCNISFIPFTTKHHIHYLKNRDRINALVYYDNQYHALEDKVIIRVAAKKDRNGNIFIPEPYQRRSFHGVVVDTGVKCKYVKKGDKVIFNRFSGTTIHSNIYGIDHPMMVNVDYIVIREENITSIIEEDLCII